MPLISPEYSASSFPVSSKELARAAEVIRGGGIVAFPTETFYGLAVDPFNVDALERLFLLKKRAKDKPVLVLIDKFENLGQLVEEPPHLYRELISEFWPGPLTLVFPGRDKLPELLTDLSGTVAVRLSSHPVARRLARAVGGCITGTSANPSGVPAAVASSSLDELFPAGLDYIVDGGTVPGGSGSTIVGIEDGRLKLIRDGSIPYEDVIEKHLAASM